jgi:hypothetical protein
MAEKYASDATKDVKFGIVYENDLGEAIHNYSIRAFPTYVLFQSSQEVNRVEGVNLAGIEAMINSAGCANETMAGPGHALGGDGPTVALSPAEARAARLARLEGGGAAAAAAAPEAAKSPEQEPEKEPAKEPAKDVEMKDAPAADEEGEKKDGEDTNMEDAEKKDETEQVCPTAKLDQESVKQLTDSMGFSLIRAQKGLLYGNGGTVEGAVEWLMQHQDDDDIDEPIPKETRKAQSYKCNECGKILSNMANLELVCPLVLFGFGLDFLLLLSVLIVYPHRCLHPMNINEYETPLSWSLARQQNGAF